MFVRITKALALVASLTVAPTSADAQAFSNRVQCAMVDGQTEAPYELEYTIRLVREADRIAQKVMVTFDETDRIPFDNARAWQGPGVVLTAGLDSGPLLLTVSRRMEAMLVRTDINARTVDVDLGTCEVIE